MYDASGLDHAPVVTPRPNRPSTETQLVTAPGSDASPTANPATAPSTAATSAGCTPAESGGNSTTNCAASVPCPPPTDDDRSGGRTSTSPFAAPRTSPPG